MGHFIYLFNISSRFCGCPALSPLLISKVNINTKENCVSLPQSVLWATGRSWPTALDSQNGQGVVRTNSDPQTIRGRNWSINIPLSSRLSRMILRHALYGFSVPRGIAGEVKWHVPRTLSCPVKTTPITHWMRRSPGGFEAYWPEHQRNWRFAELRQSLLSLC